MGNWDGHVQQPRISRTCGHTDETPAPVSAPHPKTRLHNLGGAEQLPSRAQPQIGGHPRGLQPPRSLPERGAPGTSHSRAPKAEFCCWFFFF